VDLYKVQRRLGHKTGLMTQRYAHHSPESLRDGVRGLEDPRPEKVSTNLAQRAGITDAKHWWVLSARVTFDNAMKSTRLKRSL
jgi:hypothetical protein